jgi:hypothetical protein
MAKEYKNKLAVAGTKAMNRTKRINHGLPPALLIHPSPEKDRRVKRVHHSIEKSRIHGKGEERKAGDEKLLAKGKWERLCFMWRLPLRGSLNRGFMD